MATADTKEHPALSPEALNVLDALTTALCVGCPGQREEGTCEECPVAVEESARRKAGV